MQQKQKKKGSARAALLFYMDFIMYGFQQVVCKVLKTHSPALMPNISLSMPDNNLGLLKTTTFIKLPPITVDHINLKKLKAMISKSTTAINSANSREHTIASSTPRPNQKDMIGSNGLHLRHIAPPPLTYLV